MADAPAAASPSAAALPAELDALLHALELDRRVHLSQRLDSWLETEEGKNVARTLQSKGDAAPDTAAAPPRFQSLCFSVFSWISQQLDKRTKAAKQGGREAQPLLVALSASHGSDGAALAGALKFLFEAEGRQTVALSLDAFYALAGKQEKLAQKHSGNPLLEGPGNPGTHEPLLAACVLESLKRNTPECAVQVPVYDKTLNDGRGDRLCVTDWPKIETGKIQLILLEGWVLGFKAAAEPTADAFSSLTKEELEWMKPVNKALQEYEAVHALVDAWIVLQADSPERLVDWQVEEKARRRASEGEKAAEEACASVEKFLPTYKAFLPRLRENGPDGATAETPVLDIVLGEKRQLEKVTLKGA
ncbi:glycerate kinase [Toxoplasma gondii VEG]|uniref:Glycerate kinase n=1 Tax=Toxoplasma gondii (strain ATCC 50861 / VEG) TaxID=432359 RepID=V4ZCI9_TOXGV|nr:glycerate kinase [Toxoplasma gondii VEG]CEL73196.1 TPA: glycerate kinase [Toxoplasma gondii VEG]